MRACLSCAMNSGLQIGSEAWAKSSTGMLKKLAAMARTRILDRVQEAVWLTEPNFNRSSQNDAIRTYIRTENPGTSRETSVIRSVGWNVALQVLYTSNNDEGKLNKTHRTRLKWRQASNQTGVNYPMCNIKNLAFPQHPPIRYHHEIGLTLTKVYLALKFE
jgi:hypothetical protein